MWQNYLTSITEPIGSFSSDHVATLIRIWGQACEHLGAQCPIPITKATSDGALLLAWDNGSEYIDVEVTPKGQFHWYFRDRRTGEVHGSSDEPLIRLGSDFFDKLAAVLTAFPNCRD